MVNRREGTSAQQLCQQQPGFLSRAGRQLLMPRIVAMAKKRLAPLKVLFIGNSYTYSNDLPTKFAKLAKSGNHAVEVGVDAQGGWTLADHVKATDTSDTLSSKRWTYVVLQEQSQIPAVQQSRMHSMYPAARILVKQVRNIGAKPLFFVTWAHQQGAPENGMRDYAAMQTQINEGYYALSQELNVPVVVGEDRYEAASGTTPHGQTRAPAHSRRDAETARSAHRQRATQQLSSASGT